MILRVLLSVVLPAWKHEREGLRRSVCGLSDFELFCSSAVVGIPELTSRFMASMLLKESPVTTNCGHWSCLVLSLGQAQRCHWRFGIRCRTVAIADIPLEPESPGDS